MEEHTKGKKLPVKRRVLQVSGVREMGSDFVPFKTSENVDVKEDGTYEKSYRRSVGSPLESHTSSTEDYNRWVVCYLNVTF